jgi:hypothetical protein
LQDNHSKNVAVIIFTYLTIKAISLHLPRNLAFPLTSDTPFKYKTSLQKAPRMTYILGSRCSNGVVLEHGGTFELFDIEIVDYFKTAQGCNRTVPREQFILEASEIARKYGNFEILMALEGKPATLKHMTKNGEIESVDEWMAVGTGEPAGRFFLIHLLLVDPQLKVNRSYYYGIEI